MPIICGKAEEGNKLLIHGFETYSLLPCLLGELVIVLKALGVENVPIICGKAEEGNKLLIRSLDYDWLEVFKRIIEDLFM